MNKIIKVSAIGAIALLTLSGCSSDTPTETKTSAIMLNDSVVTTGDSIGFSFSKGLTPEGWKEIEVDQAELDALKAGGGYVSETKGFSLTGDNLECMITGSVDSFPVTLGIQGSGDMTLTKGLLTERNVTESEPVIVGPKGNQIEMLKTVTTDKMESSKDGNPENATPLENVRQGYLRVLDIESKGNEAEPTAPALRVDYECIGTDKLDEKIIKQLEQAIVFEGITTRTSEG